MAEMTSALLVEKAMASAGDDMADIYHKTLQMPAPKWDKYSPTISHEGHLRALSQGDAKKNKDILEQGGIKACFAVLAIREDPAPLRYVLTIVFNTLREDSSCYKFLESSLKSGFDMEKPLNEVLQRPGVDPYVADKSAWLLSSLMGHFPRFFNQGQVLALVQNLLMNQGCTEQGVLDAITNILKCEGYRVPVFQHIGVPHRIFKRMERGAPSPLMYKSVFAVWMLSFTPAVTEGMQKEGVIKKIKEILIASRTEKVIRLCLTVLKNFLSQKAICEDIVKEGVLEAVQPLEFEKWRDAELYEDIRDVALLISTEVKELSSFDKYEEELKTNRLTWGYLHTSKFWAENVANFEGKDGKRSPAIDMLATILLSDYSSPTTLAVACHDIGEFVARHPLGKKTISSLPGVKEKVMSLMGQTEPEFREVRREALLCCQKIMLNKWQDLEKKA